MKLNKIFTFATLAAAMFSAISCSDTAADYEGPGAWDANENYANVYFQITSKTDMVDPAEATVTTVELYRRNTSSAITVPLTILTNTDDAFTVGNAEFAAGDSVTTITIDYSKAGVGSPYTLELAIEGADYVSSYSSNTVYTYTVTRVKWNLIGKGTFTENFWYEGANEVEIYQRDDEPTYFRIMNPFNDMTEGEADGSQSEYVEINVLKKGDTFRDVKLTVSDLVYFSPMNTGYFHSTYGNYVYLYHPSAFTNFQTEDSWSHNKVLDWQEPEGDDDNALPGRIQLAPYYYIPGVGGWNYTTADDIVIIDFPGYEAAYVASIEDYDWEPVFTTGEYTSTLMGSTSAGVTLYKGVPKEDVEKANEGCFERFEQTYGGTPYYIESPYVDGKNLVFLVKNGRISTFKEDEDHDYEYQETGLTALGQNVYANILSSSLFSENEITLDITFQTLPDSKTGEYIDYGTTTETLANISWTKVGTGTYTYTLFFADYDEETEEDIPVEDGPLEIYQRDDQPSVYKVTDWGYGVDFTFTWNKSTNACTIPMQFVGYVHPSYGQVFVSDIATWQGNAGYYENYPCFYDSETSLFTFNVSYFVSAGSFGYGEETLKVTWDAAAARGPQAKHTTVKPSSNLRLIKGETPFSNRFVGKKVQKEKHGEFKNPGAPLF